MGDYVRTTRECSFDNLDLLLNSAIRTYIDRNELGDIETTLLICCETTSTRKKRGLLGSKNEVLRTGMIVTPKWLIWATGKENEQPGVLSARLREIQVQDYAQSEMAKLVQDSGLNISGLRTDVSGAGTAFIGLGTESAAQKFRAILKEACAKA